MSDSEKTLETALSELNEIVQKMDKPEIPLDESFQLYQEGIKLVQFCNDKIEKVEKEITILDEESGNNEF